MTVLNTEDGATAKKKLKSGWRMSAGSVQGMSDSAMNATPTP